MSVSPGRVEWKRFSDYSAHGGAFGTTLHVVVSEKEMLDTAVEFVTEILTDVDAACSRFRPDSELVRLNQRAGTWVAVSDLFLDVIAVALEAAAMTDGALDPTVGQALVDAGYDRNFEEISSRPNAADKDRLGGHKAGPSSWKDVQLDLDSARIRLPEGTQLDLGATAKSLAADLCAQAVKAAFPDGGVLVNLGGDVALMGEPSSRAEWIVQISEESSTAADNVSEKIAIRHGGVATSNVGTRAWTKGTERAHHIIDPATAKPSASDVCMASVVGPTCCAANTAATAAVVLGTKSIPWLISERLPARLVHRNGTISRVAGWPAEAAA